MWTKRASMRRWMMMIIYTIKRICTPSLCSKCFWTCETDLIHFAVALSQHHLQSEKWHLEGNFFTWITANSVVLISCFARFFGEIKHGFLSPVIGLRSSSLSLSLSSSFLDFIQEVILSHDFAFACAGWVEVEVNPLLADSAGLVTPSSTESTSE